MSKILTNLDLNKNELQNARIQNLAAFPTNPALGQVFFHSTDKTFYGWNGSTWRDLGQVLTGDSIITLLNGSSLKIDDDNLSANVADAIAKKHLHSNMTVLNGMEVAFTNALKAKLDNIEAEANKYIHPSTHSLDIITETTTKKIMTSDERTKLSGISIGATKVEVSATNGNIKIDGIEKTVYAHPANHDDRYYTETEIDTKLATKSDTTHNHTLAGLSEKNYSSLAGRPADDNFNTLSALIESADDDTLLIYDTSASAYRKITKGNLLTGIANDSTYVFIKHQEEFTATENQTVFNLTKGSYQPNTDRMSVFIWGGKQPLSAYSETSSVSVTLSSGVEAGTRVILEYISVVSALDFIHVENHKIGGVDPLSPADIGASAVGHIHDDRYYTETEIDTKLGTKVDKITGKGLSTEDYTTVEKNKLSGIASGAEVNQNAFSNIKVGTTTVAADSKTDTLELVAGTGITLTPDATNDKITITGVNQYIHPDNHPASMITGLSTVATTGSYNDLNNKPSLGTAASKNTGTASGNIPILGTGGKLDTAVLPAIAITDTFVVNTEAAMLALTVETGDVCVRTDLNKSFILKGTTPSLLSDWQELLTPTDVVTSVAGKTGAVTLTKSDVGLGNVDNIQQATKTEFNTHNSDSTRHITSGERTTWHAKPGKYTANIGNGTATEFTLTHSLGTKDIVIGLEEVATGEMVFTDIQKIDTNSIKILFAAAPSLNQFRATVVG